MRGWMWLSMILLIFVFIMSLFYGDCILRRVNPKMCGAKNGSFVVNPGFAMSPRNDCNGICSFSVDSLVKAIAQCDKDLCNLFYYDGSQMVYLLPDSPQIQAKGGIYTRIGTIS